MERVLEKPGPFTTPFTFTYVWPLCWCAKRVLQIPRVGRRWRWETSRDVRIDATRGGATRFALCVVRGVLRRSHLPTHLTGNKNHPREYEARRGIFEVRVFPRARAQRAGHEVWQVRPLRSVFFEYKPVLTDTPHQVDEAIKNTKALKYIIAFKWT